MTITEDRPSSSTTLSPPERKARRKRILAWVLPAIGVALIASLFLLTQHLLANGLGERRDALPEEVSANNTTQFGEAGSAYAVQYQVVTLNLSDRPIAAADLSMADDAQAIIAPGYGFLDTTMFVGEGGGINGQGYFSEMMSSVTATTERGVVQRIDLERSPVGWAEFPSAMRAVQLGSTAFGWEVGQADIDAFTTRTAEAVRRGEPISWEIEAAGLMGVPVSGAVSCSAEGLCIVSYSVDVSGQSVGD